MLVAPEGINGTIAGSRDAIDQFLRSIKLDARFSSLVHKESMTDTMPFHRMNVKIKRELITMKRPNANPSKCKGVYIEPKDWNQLLEDPNVVLIDTRNDYEVAIGRFQNAVNPQTKIFSEFPDFVEKNLTDLKGKKIAMYCTGGIRYIHKCWPYCFLLNLYLK